MLLSKNIGLLSLYSTIYFQQVFVASSITITPTTINDPYLNYVVLNINGDTALSGNNNTFLDSGFRNISPTGNVTQGTFSPFSPAGWSGYFNGSSYLTVPDNDALELSTGNFTIDVWINTNVLGTNKLIISKDQNENINWGNLSLSIASNNLINFVCNPNFNNATGQVNLISTTAIVVNKWMHVAVSRSGNDWYLFINGVIEHTTNSSVGFRDSPSLFYIGCSLNSNAAVSFFNGYISNLRVIKGTALYTTNFTPNSAEPLKLLPNTSLLTLQDNRFKDNSRNNFTLNATDTPQVQPFSPIAPAVDYTPSLHGGSAYFDGSSDITLPDNPAWDVGGNYTLEFWFNCTADSALNGSSVRDACLVAQSESNTFGWSIIIRGNSTTTGTKIGFNAGNVVITESTASIPKNVWHHFALVTNGSTATIYLNGINVASGAYTTTTNYSALLSIGRLYNITPDTYRNYFIGYISNLRVVKKQAVYTSNFTPPSRPVTATSNGGASVGTTAVPNLSVTPSLLLDFDNGGIIDRSYKNDALVFGDTKTQTLSSKFGTGSLYFDGTGDYLKVDRYLDLNASQWTIETWFNLADVTGANETLINFQPHTTITFVIRNSALSFYIGNGTGSWSATDMSSSAILSSNRWHHAALVRNGNRVTSYIDGVSAATTTSTPSGFNGSAYIGTGFNTSVIEPLNGYIEDFRITKGVARYTGASFTPPSKLQANNSDPYYSNVVLFLDGNNIGSNVNNEFRATAGDAARLAITRTGATQGSFSPFSPNGWSGYFNGSSFLKSTGTTIGNGDFTIECWVYLNALGDRHFIDIDNGSFSNAVLSLDSGTNQFRFLIRNDGSNTGQQLDIKSSLVAQTNTWYHVCGVANGNTGTLYINGSSTLGNTGTIAAGRSITGNTYRIGVNSDETTRFLNGYISNLRIVKGQALYTSTFTPPTGPLPALSGSGFSTSLLTLQDNRFKDNSPNNFTLSVGAGTPSVQAFNPYKQSTAYSPTVHGGSGYFGSSYLTVPANAGFSLNGDFTIEFWINTTTWTVDTTYARVIISMGTGTDAINLLKIIFSDGTTSGNNLSIYTNSHLLVGAAGVANGTWRHVALTRSGTSLKLFLDGVQTGSTVNNSQSFNAGATTDVQIGRHNNAIDGRYLGYISNLRIVKGRALYTSNFTPPTSPVTAVNGTSLLLNFDNGYAIDSTGNNVITTVGDSRTDVLNTAPLSSSTGSLYFDGTANTYITGIYNDLYAFSSGTPFTIECWFNIKANSALVSSSRNAAIINTSKSTGFDGYGLYILGDATNTGTGIRFQQYGASGAAESITATINLNKNTWYHLALVRNNLNQYSIYINGQSLTITGSIPTYPNIYGTNFRIGANNEVAFISLFNGYIDDFRITKGVARYTNNFTPQTYENPTSNILTYPTDPYRNLVVLDLNADTVNNEQNNTFLDRSGNNLTITRSGATTQGSFSPFSPAGWSGYFNGQNGNLSILNPNKTIGSISGDFTIECWVNWIETPPGNSGGNERQIIGQHDWPGVVTSAVNWWTIMGISTGVIIYLNNNDGSNNVITSTNFAWNANVWYHLAVSRLNGVLRIYVNGINVTPGGTANTTRTIFADDTTLGIGADNVGDQVKCNAYISNLRIVKGQALYTSNFTPPTAALTTTSTVGGVTLSAENVALLTLQDNRFKDNSNNNLTITPNGTPSVKPFSPFQPTATYSPTVHGGSGYFNGSYLEAGISSSLNVNSDYTIETWFYKTGTSTNGSSLFLFSSSTTNGTHIYFNTSNQLLINNGVVESTTFTTPIISNNVWYHLAAVRSGTVTTVYLNGVSIGTSTYTPNTTDRVSIGGFVVASYRFVGYLSNIRVVRGVAITPPVGGPTASVQAVSGTSLLLNFDNAGVVNSTGKNNVTTYSTSKVDYANLKYGSGALKFNGTTDYMQVGTASDWTFLHSPSAKWTIEFWVYNNSSAIGTLLDTNGSTLGAHGISLQKKDNNTLDLFVTNNTSGNFVIRATTTATIPLSTWTHIAITYDHSLTSNNMIVYFNGLSSLAVTKTAQTPSTTVPANTLSIGAYGNGAGQFFNGSIDELRITNAVRYTGNFPLTSYSQLRDPNQVQITYLIVGGGGGGGVGENHAAGGGGGGGGGGGLLYSTSDFDIGTILPIVVGAGGNSDTKGGDSSLGIISVYGGGYGGGDANHVITNSGGSGGNGGGGSGDGLDRSGGISLYSTGYSGGNGNISRSAGGGGGSSQKGFDATASGGGNGGNGASYPITASNNTYAGGGGGGRGGNLTVGGTGGTGGGGNGGNSTTGATDGSANTGGGGGGGRSLGTGGGSASQPGASGGSGIVILSVPTRLFSNKVSGNPTITVIGENTIITYNNLGSYTV